MHQEHLERIVSTNAAASMRCLAAAERAVLEGRFNLAKVLRACAHAARVASLTAARTLAQGAAPITVLGDTSAFFEHQSIDVLEAASPLRDVLRRALQSLEGNRDILESDVAQSLWGCQVCGAIVETRAPQRCGGCGALSFEFEWFGPFYSGTFDRLGRRSPAAVARIVQDSPGRLATLLQGVDEEQLARRPSPDEWCMKEVAGHLVDVTELFSWRARRILDASSPPSLDEPLPPWRLLETKGYGNTPATVIAERFSMAT